LNDGGKAAAASDPDRHLIVLMRSGMAAERRNEPRYQNLLSFAPAKGQQSLHSY
jgi:hypothetical protein